MDFMEFLLELAMIMLVLPHWRRDGQLLMLILEAEGKRVINGINRHWARIEIELGKILSNVLGF